MRYTGKQMATGAVIALWGCNTGFNIVQNNFERNDWVPRILGAATTDHVQDIAGVFGKEFRLIDRPDGRNLDLNLDTMEFRSEPAGAAVLHFSIEG